jgi:hypothetical protein
MVSRSSKAARFLMTLMLGASPARFPVPRRLTSYRILLGRTPRVGFDHDAPHSSLQVFAQIWKTFPHICTPYILNMHAQHQMQICPRFS